MGDETDPDGDADPAESRDSTEQSGDSTERSGDSTEQSDDAPDGADADAPDDADAPEDAADESEPVGDAGDDAGEAADDAEQVADDAGDPSDPDAGGEQGGSGLSTPDADALADPGQHPGETGEAPRDADSDAGDATSGGDGAADDDRAADDATAPAGGTVGNDPDAGGTADDGSYGPEDAPTVTDSPPEEAGDPLPDDPIAESDGAEGAPGEADGGVVTGDDGIVPAEEPEQTGDLWEDARPSEPPDDEEMPLADHIEEMIRRLAVVVAIAGTVSIVLFPLAEVPIDFLWNSILPGGGETDPRVYGPLELMFTRLKVASLGGLVIALPVFVYETYQFMRPGLYPHERRYYLAAVPTSLVLALVGIGFAYFFVLPAIFIYFLHYTEDAALVAFSLKKTFDLILILMGYLAIVFQIPLFIMLAIMMGLTTREWLASRRIYFWGGFLGISFIFGVDPTGMAPIIVAATMVVLFEGTLLLLKWTGRG